jgi:hypothetical protein
LTRRERHSNSLSGGASRRISLRNDDDDNNDEQCCQRPVGAGRREARRLLRRGACSGRAPAAGQGDYQGSSRCRQRPAPPRTALPCAKPSTLGLEAQANSPANSIFTFLCHAPDANVKPNVTSGLTRVAPGLRTLGWIPACGVPAANRLCTQGNVFDWVTVCMLSPRDQSSEPGRKSEIDRANGTSNSLHRAEILAVCHSHSTRKTAGSSTARSDDALGRCSGASARAGYR